MPVGKEKMIKNSKYETTGETMGYGSRTLHRIRAVKDFDRVKAGDLGGWIEKESNLSEEGDCWVADEARVYGNARVYENGWVLDNAEVYGNAKVYGYANVFDEAKVCDYAGIYGNAGVFGMASVCGQSRIYGSAAVCGRAFFLNYEHISKGVWTNDEDYYD